MRKRTQDTTAFTTRVGDAERERALAVLNENHAFGRLATEEYDDRVSQAFVARTEADLLRLVHDLPASSRTPGAPSARRSVVPDLPGRFWTHVAAPVAGVGATAYGTSTAFMSSAPHATDTATVACLVTGFIAFAIGRISRRR